MPLQIIKTDLLKPYQELIDNHSLDLAFNNLKDKYLFASTTASAVGIKMTLTLAYPLHFYAYERLWLLFS